MPTQISQREAVFLAVKGTLNADFKEGTRVTLSNDQRKTVIEAIVKDFQDKKVVLKDTPSNHEKLATPALLKTYVNGLLNNWLKRDPRINGVPKKVKPVVAAPATLATEKVAAPIAATPTKQESTAPAAVTPTKSEQAAKPDPKAGKDTKR